MGIADYIAIAAIILVVGAAALYIIRAKKRGEKCVGCPYARQCGGKCNDKENHRTEADYNKNKR